MSIEERRKLYLRLDRMIRMKVPGKANELANRLGISRSTLFRCMDEMKEVGTPIEYDACNGRYCYLKKGRFQFGFLSEDELRSISGGFIKNFRNNFISLRF